MIRLFRHYIPLSLVILTAAELFFFFLIAQIGASRPEGAFESTSLFDAYRPWVFAAVFTFLNTMFGLYDWEWTTGMRSLIGRVAGGTVIGALIIAGGASLIPELFPSGVGFLLSVVLVAVFAVCVRMLLIAWGKTSLFKKRILVLGTGSRAAKIEKIASPSEIQGATIVGYIPTGSSPSFVPHSRLIHDRRSLYEVAMEHRATCIVVAVRERRHGGLPISELLECKLRGLEILDLPEFFEQQTGILGLEFTNASWIIFSEGFRHGSQRDVVKRVFDLLVSSIFLLMLLPVILLTAFLIKLESAGPVFYTQERVGQFGRSFTIFKFRSMRTDAEKHGAVWARQNDDRTTRVGRVIRRTRIDELPQILNVFLGHMSFVGPRPERPIFVNKLAEQIPYYNARHSVKPGITGWAQVKFPYGASVEDAMHKLQYDLYYVKNHSLFLDLMILLQTAQVVVLGKGVR